MLQGYGFSPIWIRRCLLRHPWFENCLPHNLSWYVFFPLWMLRCGCIWHFLLLFWVNYLSYTLPWCDCSHVWMRRCLAKHPLKEKKSYCIHCSDMFFTSVWVRICMFRCPSHGNILPHTSLWYVFFSCVDALVYVQLFYSWKHIVAYITTTCFSPVWLEWCVQIFIPCMMFV